MSEPEVNGSYNYPTSILTEVSPAKAALILPNTLNQSQQINDELLKWINNYNSTVVNYNNQLKRLVEDGANIISSKSNMANFNKYWNCLLTSLLLESQTNDLLIKNVGNDILNPLKVNKEDVKLSELLINSQELQETSQDITAGKQNAEIQWNYKAPQIFQNFENYKSCEFQLLFNVILNFFQIHNAKLTKNLQNNENSSNYLVSNFKLDLEMQQYLDYILKADFKQVSPYGQQLAQQLYAQQQHATKHNKRLSSLGSSMLSHDSKHNHNHKLPQPPTIASTSTSQKEKRQSKIKSKVGSIFGRKKKTSKVSTSETVPENESLYSNTSRPLTANESVPSRRGSVARSFDATSKLSEPSKSTQQRSGVTKTAKPLSSSLQFYTQTASGQPQYGGPGGESQLGSAVYPIQESPAQPQAGQQQQPQQQPDLNVVDTKLPFGSATNVMGQQPETSGLATAAPHSAGGLPEQQSVPASQKHGISTTTGVIAGAAVGAIGATVGVVGSKLHPQTPSTQPSQQQDVFASNDDSSKNKESLSTSTESEVPFVGGEPVNSSDSEKLLNPSTPKDFATMSQKPEESPNFIKYDESNSSDNDELSEDDTKRKSMLEKHDLNEEFSAPPRQSFDQYTSSEYSGLVGQESRNSSGKYSFEVGDEKHINDAGFPRGVSEPESEGTTAKPNVIQSKPPPPPSRKVIHHEESVGSKRGGVNSQYFHNLPPTRDSIIQPRDVSGATFGGLIAQNTGNSLIKQDLFKHFDTSDYVSNDGLNCSVAEVINVTFKDGRATKAQVIGEIAFNYKLGDDEDLPPQKPISLEIPNSFDKLILNHDLLQNVGGNIFQLTPNFITSKTLGGLKYLNKLQESQIPILIQQIWKYEDHQSSLMINLKLNPSIKSKVVLENLIVSVALNSDVESTSASSKPQGSFNKEKSRITWRYTQPLVLGGSGLNEEKLIARFMTNGRGSEHEGGIQIKFQIHEPLFSSTTIVDHDTNHVIPTSRNMITGNYSGHE
jgi:hypothetical protein